MSVESDRLKQFIEEGRLIRQAWTLPDVDGRERACLLAAMVPAVAKSHSAAVCPAALMPRWFAELTPWIDDSGSVPAWRGVVRRYADLASRWHVLDATAWARLEYAMRSVALREAVKHVSPSVARICNDAIVLCDRAAAGDVPTTVEFAAVRNAATCADGVATTNIRVHDAFAARAAHSAMFTAHRSTVLTAGTAAASARDADRIIDGILDCLEAAIVKAEGLPEVPQVPELHPMALQTPATATLAETPPSTLKAG